MIINENNSRENIIQILNSAYDIRVNNLSQSIQMISSIVNEPIFDQNQDLLAKAYTHLSLFEMIVSNYEVSKKYADNAMSIYKAIGDKIGIANVKYIWASINYRTNNFHLGLVYFMDAFHQYELSDDYAGMSKCKKSIGTILEFMGEFDRVILIYEDAIKYARLAKDTNLESNALNNLSGIYIKKGESRIALDILTTALNMKLITNDKRGLAFTYYGFSRLWLSKSDYDEAKIYLDKSIQLHTEMGEKVGLVMAFRRLGQIYYSTNKFKEAKKILLKAVEIANINDVNVIKYKCYYDLYILYKIQDKKSKAMEYLELHLQNKEFIINLQSMSILNNYDEIVKMKTAQKQIELDKAKAKITEEKILNEQKLKVKQEFISIISHEIRTPLNAITTVISLLENKIADDLKSEYNILDFSSKHLMHIINDILYYSKLDSGKVTLDNRKIKINDVFKNFEAIYTTQAKEKNIEFILNVDPKLASEYLIDKTKLTQVLDNLIRNAIKFTKIGFVELRVTVKEINQTVDTILFQVVDTGKGISKKHQMHVFESFYQVKHDISRENEGTGLGLSIVKKLLDIFNSEIIVESKTNQGTTFSFELSLNKVKNIDNNQILQSSINFEDKKILIVEDNAINAKVLGKLLKNWKIVFIVAKNGVEAIEYANTEKFDHILMDIHMPILNGFQAAKEIKINNNLNKNTPILALSADISAIDNEEYNQYFDDFLLKPIDINKLYAKLASLE